MIANAASMILARNHHSGDPTHSLEDRRATERIVRAGQIPGIEVFYHVVFGE